MSIRLEGLDGPESVGEHIQTLRPWNPKMGSGVFDEKALEYEITRIWGAAGAHAEVFYEICKKAGIKL